MHCPACSQTLRENADACGHCGFQLEVADNMFGTAPHLEPGLTDLAGVLSQEDQWRVLEALGKSTDKLEQVTFACVTTRVPLQISLPVFTFWLFNRGGVVPATDRGARCRVLLLVVDVDHGRTACMVGYGLEPFVNESVLQRIADAGSPGLVQHEYAEALIAALACAVEELSEIVESIPLGFGLAEVDEDSEAQGPEVYAY